MLQNVSREELLEEFIVPSVVPGLTLCLRRLTMPLLHPIGELCNEHLPGQNIHAVLKENVIDKLKSDYDFILVDSGPHLDAFLKMLWPRPIYCLHLCRLQRLISTHRLNTLPAFLSW